MSARHIVIFGAASEIAEQIARELARRGYVLTLCGRDRGRLDDIAADLRHRGARDCTVYRFDGGEDEPADVLAACNESEPITDCLIAQARPQPGADATAAELMGYFRVNTVASIAAMHSAAEHIGAHGEGGCVAWLSSPAGLRGRRSNWLYGASKAGADIALEGLSGVYRASGVRMLCVRPGPTRTRFNAGLTPSALWSSPERVGGRIATLIAERRAGERYVPGFWRLPALLLRALPRWALVRLQG